MKRWQLFQSNNQKIPWNDIIRILSHNSCTFPWSITTIDIFSIKGVGGLRFRTIPRYDTTDSLRRDLCCWLMHSHSQIPWPFPFIHSRHFQVLFRSRPIVSSSSHLLILASSHPLIFSSSHIFNARCESEFRFYPSSTERYVPGIAALLAYAIPVVQVQGTDDAVHWYTNA